ncbi:MAG TPA: alpha-L-fucosidase [Armatimonadota bacterium]|jgi:alpha-L-fucosidase
MTQTELAAQEARLAWLREARLGMFVHWGLYSILGRGEWTMNRERIPIPEYEKLVDQFTAEKFDADALAGLACEMGAKYMIFTTKHHEGFCLFDSQLTDYTSVKRGPKRDFVREVVDACRRAGLGIALYFSLNDWHHQPDATDGLENPKAYENFISYVHGQIRELLTNYGKIDTMWYDGWWPFDAKGWKAEEMNAMARALQPHILFNNRNALPGDFATPEQHVTPTPGRLWEACLTLNDNWGFAYNDENWKSPQQLLDYVLTAAQFQGNLVMNVGPRADGSIPEIYHQTFSAIGDVVRANPAAFLNTDYHDMDWACIGKFTQKGNTAFLHVLRWPGETLTIAGLECQAKSARMLASGAPVNFSQVADKLVLSGLPATAPNPLDTVIAIEMDRKPRRYLTGGMRVPNVPHCQYDPVDPNMLALP